MCRDIYVDKARTYVVATSWWTTKSNLNSIALIYCNQTFPHILLSKSSDQIGIIQILSYLIKDILIITLCNCVYKIHYNIRNMILDPLIT